MQNRGGALVLAMLAALAGSSAARAGEAQLPPASASPIETVLVRAQKRGIEEDAQSVPIALTAIGGARIDALHAGDLEELSARAPNVALADAGTVPGFANFVIRGLGINSTIPSVEPTVGVFVDGIYLGQSSGAVLDLFDLQDVEILRGPQATLFGRNTTGGAILVNTRRPGDTFAVQGRVRIESGLQESAGLSIEGPIGNGLKAKIAGYYENDAGWFTNRFDGKGFGERENGFVRPTIVWTPSEAFDTALIYQHGWARGDGAPAQNPKYRSGFALDLDFPGYHRLDQDAVTLESNLRMIPGVVTNLFGYRRLDQEAADDIDGQPSPLFHAYSVLRQHQFSDELRYSGRIFDRLDVTAGLYYFTQSFFYLERRALFGGAIDSAMGAEVEDTNYAAFAEAAYELTPQWGVIAGGRFTREEKTARIATFVPSTAGSLCNFGAETCVYNFPGPRFAGAPGSESWDHFLPKLGLTYRPNEDMLVYANWTRGVRSGGYNVRNTSFVVPPGPYGPELQDAFELGMKSDWLERRLRVNGALFYDKIRDMQRDVNMTDPLAGVIQATRNTADATILGFEAELTGAVTDELVLNANAGFADGHYDKVYLDLDGGGVGASDLGLGIPRLSKWSYALGAAYTRDFAGAYTLALRTDYGYRSRAASTDSNTAFLVAVNELTASATLLFPRRHWGLAVYGRNLLGRATEGIVTPLPAALGGGAFRPLNEGRVIGAEASFSY